MCFRVSANGCDFKKDTRQLPPGYMQNLHNIIRMVYRQAMKKADGPRWDGRLGWRLMLGGIRP